MPSNRTQADLKDDCVQKAVLKCPEPEPENLKKVTGNILKSEEANSDRRPTLIQHTQEDPRRQRDHSEEQKLDEDHLAQRTQYLGSSYSKRSAIALSRASSNAPPTTSRPQLNQPHPISFFQSKADTQNFSKSGQDDASVQFKKNNLHAFEKQSTLATGLN